MVPLQHDGSDVSPVVARKPASGSRRGEIPGADHSIDPIWRLQIRETLRSVRREPVSFWLACVYIVLEYVRPQQIYPAIDVIPWAQATILAALAASALENGRLRFATPVTGGVIAFLAVVVLSSITAFDPSRAWGEFAMFGSWVVIYIMITSIVTTERRFFVFLALFLLSSFKMSQTATRVWAMRGFAFRDWGVAGAPGWFTNSGEFGIQMCVFLPLSIYFILAVRPYISTWKFRLVCLMPITAVMGAIASSSRGALVGMGLVGAWMVARSRYRAKAAVGLVATGLMVWLLLPSESKSRFASTGQDETSMSRLVLWENGMDMIKDHPVLGVGYRNFAPYLSRQHPEIRGTLLPHNIFIEAGAELGSLGLFALFGLIVLTFVVNRRTRRLGRRLGERGRFLELSAFGLDGALVGYIGSGFFVTVLYYPYLWINLAMTAALYIAAQDTARRESSLRGTTSRSRSRAQGHAIPTPAPQMRVGS